MVYPIVKFVQYRLHVPTRVLSIIVSLLFVVAVIGGIFYLIIPPMFEQFDKLSEVLSRYLHEKTHISNFPVAIQQWIGDNREAIQSFFQQEDVVEAIKNAQSLFRDRADGKRAGQRRGVAHHAALPVFHPT